MQSIPPWIYLCCFSTAEIEQFVNKHHPNPTDIMWACQNQLYHVWCRPRKRSIVHGFFTYEYGTISLLSAADDNNFFSEINAPSGINGDINKVRGSMLCDLIRKQRSMRFLTLDAEGVLHFLRVKTRHSSSARQWSGELRYLCTSTLSEAEKWINALQPTPGGIQCCVDWPYMHIFVDDIGPCGTHYEFIRESDVPHDLIAENRCVVFGFTADGDCLFLELHNSDDDDDGKHGDDEKLDYRVDYYDDKNNSDNSTRLLSPPPPPSDQVRYPDAFSQPIDGVMDTEAKMRNLFDQMDRDSTGVITQAELQTLFKTVETFGVKNRQSALQEVLKMHLQGEQEKNITYEEFCTYILKAIQW
jgi:hypothetical protein